MSKLDKGKFGRRTWRSKGFRLNADNGHIDVRLLPTILSGPNGSPSTVDVRVAEWCGTQVAAKTIRLPTWTNQAAEGEKSTDQVAVDFNHLATYNRRIAQEAQFLGQLRHPHLAQLYGIAYDDQQRPMFLSELLTESLQQRFAYAARFSLRDVIDISLEVLSGLQYLHTLPHPVVHGSVCSANVLFAVDGTAKLTDANLSLARLHSPLSPVNTLVEADEEVTIPRAALSSNAILYLPSMALRHDSYDAVVDCSAFLVLFMAMCLHREPRPQRPFNQDRSPREESIRRQLDLADFAASVSADTSAFVSAAIARVGCGQAKESDGDSEESDDGLSSNELRQKVEELTKLDEYRRTPTTRGSPAACGQRQQRELEALVGRLQIEVAEVVVATERVMKESEADMHRRLEVVEEALRNERQSVEARLNAAREEIARVEQERADEVKKRLAMEAEIERLRHELLAGKMRRSNASPRLSASRGPFTSFSVGGHLSPTEQLELESETTPESRSTGDMAVTVSAEKRQRIEKTGTG